MSFSWYQSQKWWCRCNYPGFYYVWLSLHEFWWHSWNIYKGTAPIPEKIASPRKMIIEDKIHEKPSTMVSNGSNSSSSSSSEDEKSFEQSFKGTNYIPEKTAAPRNVAIEDKINEKPSTVSNGAHCNFSDLLFTFHFLSIFLSKVANRFMTLEKNLQIMKV